MGELFELFGPFVFVLFFLAIGFFVGGWSERSHFKSLAEREAVNDDFYVTQTKTCPDASPSGPDPTILIGEAVIATDYLKSFLAKLRNIFGGEVKSYQSLLERARREALLRIIEQARSQGHNAVCNVRFENADVGGSTTNRKGAVMVAILASATAYHRAL